jgi:proteasome lid subunit RPN8/RPN11
VSKQNKGSAGKKPPVDNRGRIVHRTFPGPSSAAAALRVSLNRKAWADLIAHGRESLDAEVCGVLVGDVCEDDQGLFVDVRGAIRGTAAREARAHVTFTHETWNQIHAELDRNYPELQIVGWYHTHPGFGVEFSSMDRFIQENFFSGKTQVAFLSDPLGSDIALAWNGEGGIEYLSRFWVDGREHAATPPGGAAASAAPTTSQTTAVAGGGDVRRELERLESRVNQLVQSLDEQQRNFYRMLMTLVVIGCLAIVGGVGYFIWTDRTDRLKPPEMRSFVPVPVKVGNETVMLGISIVDWNVPKQLDAMLDKVARMEVEERQRQERELEKLRQQQLKKPGAPKKP